MSPPPASTARRRRRRGRPGIGLRLLAAQTIVLAAGAATTAVVAAVVGPPLFREHLHRAGVPMNSPEEVHAEEAYGYATVISIGGALAVSALAALAVSFYFSRRLQRSITEVASAATDVAQGNYDVRVSSPRLGDDFDALSTAFNQMASRLQTVDSTRQQLFGDLAHEIRTPVAVLEAYIEALEDGVRTLTPQTAAMLRDQTRRLVRFSNDVAALAKAEESSVSMSYANIDVDRLTHRCVAAAQERYDNKGVALRVRLQKALPPLWADEQRLSQVLGNLLENALRHTPSGGSVEVNCVRDGDRLRIAVADTGEGIAAEHVNRVFERFYRADTARDREHGGAGLGLAIAKALVEAHGGSISVMSGGPGGGATFTLALPITPERTEQTPVTADSARI
ncbi:MULTISPECIES: HAMP domain-containing sensor histidine kinase [Mycolicibacterium]|uniref:HAMP domain-containing sensor histidine kinase n=1 Tax=Mycobacteriaceae TaxID=1762 RepID=UPI001CA364E9|nr:MULTISPECIES: ATP-binding protein [Mycolicibacterium]QZT60866.1 HAMP domain-containing protein [Mycolicibacterium austroafricanum]WND60273.1 ATP-binding protein [Mycolicibacterium vanbaalenii]